VRFTIERIRTLILIAGVLLVAALGVFLTIGRWRSPFNRRDLPKKLGIDIQQEANGFTHAEFHAGHALFKITASKVEQLKDSRYRLHSVRIEMYRPNGGGTDRIEGSEFEYDQRAGIAQAAGPVEITLDQPTSSASAASRGKNKSAPAAQPGPANPRQIHVKTVGLIFNQNSGVASSANHVEFDLPQASGSAVGASYDSAHGKLVETVVSQLGRPDDGTETTGFFSIEFSVDLKPKAQWPIGMTKPKLIKLLLKEAFGISIGSPRVQPAP